MRHESAKIYASLSAYDIADWLDVNQPLFADKIRDSFGVNDFSQINEEELLNYIYDNDKIYEMLYVEFPEFFEETITSATNTVSINPNLKMITGEDDLVYDDYTEELMSAAVDELADRGLLDATYYEKIDNIYLIVYDNDQQIMEFTIPKADLTYDLDTDIDYILDAVSEETDIYEE